MVAAAGVGSPPGLRREPRSPRPRTRHRERREHDRRRSTSQAKALKLDHSELGLPTFLCRFDLRNFRDPRRPPIPGQASSARHHRTALRAAFERGARQTEEGSHDRLSYRTSTRVTIGLTSCRIRSREPAGHDGRGSRPTICASCAARRSPCSCLHPARGAVRRPAVDARPGRRQLPEPVLCADYSDSRRGAGGRRLLPRGLELS